MTSATDNRTTELLRKLLEERGLSCQTHYLHASWRVGQKLYGAVDNLDGTLTVDNLTPEQAIAATLGNSRADYHGYEQAAIEAWESVKAWNSRAERITDDEWERYQHSVPATDENMAKFGWVRERTCKQEERGWGTEGDHARVWLTCGHDCMVPTVQDLPNYCPNCGARVVE